MDSTVNLAWLDDPKQRRGALLLIHGLVYRGSFSGPELAGRRSALQERLGAMLAADGLRQRERNRIARILLALEAAGRPGARPGVRIDRTA